MNLIIDTITSAYIERVKGGLLPRKTSNAIVIGCICSEPRHEPLNTVKPYFYEACAIIERQILIRACNVVWEKRAGQRRGGAVARRTEKDYPKTRQP